MAMDRQAGRAVRRCRVDRAGPAVGVADDIVRCDAVIALLIAEGVSPVPGGTYERACPTCNTTGQVLTAGWAAWHEEYRRLEAMPDRATRLDALMEHTRRAPAGPEHQPCPMCREVGWLPTDRGLELMEFLKRHRRRLFSSEDGAGVTIPGRDV
jgi:hypothetical protein